MKAKVNTGEYESSALVETPVLFWIRRKSCAETGVLSTFWRGQKTIFDSGMEPSETGKEKI